MACRRPSHTAIALGQTLLCLVLVCSFGFACGTMEIDVVHVATPESTATRNLHQGPTEIGAITPEGPTPAAVRLIPTATSILDGSHLSFHDPALGLALEIPLWWQTQSTQGVITRFIQEDLAGRTRAALTMEALDSATDTLELALDAVKSGAWGPHIHQVQPVTLGEFSAMRLDLTPGARRPPVFWVLMAPSGQAVIVTPGVDPDWIEPVIEVVLDTLRPIPVTSQKVSTREPRPTVTEIPASAETQDGDVSQLVEPLLIDGEKGWMFASALVDGQPKTAKLATEDGRLLAAYDTVGKLALDRNSGRLFVDQGQSGVTVLDVATGGILATVALPSPGQMSADPQVDPVSGQAFTFRGDSVFVIDHALETAIRASTARIPSSVCGEQGEDASVVQSYYDLVNHKLYLAFVTYACTPWLGHTIVSYDANTLAELGRYETGSGFHAVPFLDSLYGTTVSHLGRNVAWAWNGREAWFEEGFDGSARLQGIVADWKRQLIYEALNGKIRISKAYPRTAMGEKEMASLQGDGRLAGHDPKTDQLYFLVGGRLAIRPATALFAPPSTEAETGTPYCRPSDAAVALSASAQSLHVGQAVSVTLILTNGSNSGVRLGRIQYSLATAPTHTFSSHNLGPIESSLTLEPGDSDTVHFALQAETPVSATLTGSASYEMHAMDYSSGSWSGCQSSPLEISITP